MGGVPNSGSNSSEREMFFLKAWQTSASQYKDNKVSNVPMDESWDLVPMI